MSSSNPLKSQLLASDDTEDANVNMHDDADRTHELLMNVQKQEGVMQQIKVILTYKKYTALLPMICLYIAAGYMPSVFMSAYGAEWFAKRNCDSTAGEECLYDYATWTFYNSLFLSLRGFVSFLFSGYIGRLSDAYGRKPFLMMHIITNALPVIPLLFAYNLWPYFVLYLFGGLNGSNNSSTPIMVSFVADIIPANYRTVALGLLYLMGGIGLLIGSISAIFISVIWNDYANFIIIVIIYVFLLVYIYWYVQESLSVEHRRPFTPDDSHKMYNPFRPLRHIFEHPIVCRICIISFLISLAETGVIDTAIPYFLDQLQIRDDKVQANIITGVFILCCGLGMIVSNVGLLPVLKRQNYTDYNISILGSSIITLAMFMFACISWFPSMFLVCITGFVLTLGFIVFPSLYSIATCYLSPHEQGMGMGIIFACRGVSFAVSPFAFGYSYAAFKSIGCAFVPYIVATLICSMSIYIIIYSLKPSIAIVAAQPRRFSLSVQNLKAYEHLSQYKQVEVNSSSDDDNHQDDRTL